MGGKKKKKKNRTMEEVINICALFECRSRKENNSGILVGRALPSITKEKKEYSQEKKKKSQKKRKEVNRTFQGDAGDQGGEKKPGRQMNRKGRSGPR